MLSRTVLFLAVLVVAAGVLAGCGGSDTGKVDAQVVAGFYPIAFAVEEITAGSVSVLNTTPAGAEPHDLELTPGTVRAVVEAKMVFYFGDGFMPGLEAAVAERRATSVDLLAGEQLRSVRREDGHSVSDPHIWLDPLRYAEMARRIGAVLGEPTRADDLVRRLEALDAEYRRGLARCDRRRIVTSHAAFAYLAARYGLQQEPLVGLSPEAEPAARDIARLVSVVRATGATTIFFEPLVSPGLAETVAREARVATSVLDPLEGLTDEQLAAGADYFSIMRLNLSALREALGCR